MSKATEENVRSPEESGWSSGGDEPKLHKPEPPDEGMIVKQFCKCDNCHHWTNSADWCPTPNLNYNQNPRETSQDKKIQPLLKNENYPKPTPKIIKFSVKQSSKIKQQSVFNTLVHSETNVHPIESFSDAYFTEDIQKVLQAMNYQYSKPIQAFAWPAIFRNLNVFMIGNHKSGKTMSYLPAVCTFCASTDKKYTDFAKYKGPLVIIVCPSSRQCEKIFDLIKKIYSKIQTEPKIALITYPVSNRSNIDILITMPDSLIECLKSKMFNLKRLCHLVFEDASTLLKYNETSTYKVLEVASEMLEHRVNSAKVQLIVTSEKWTIDMEKLLSTTYLTPLVCIGNHLEAALYGGIQFEVKFLLTHEKTFYLQGTLENKYHIYKTVVVCNQDEIGTVSKWLVRNGIETIALSDDLSKEDIEQYENDWTLAKGGEYKVLLCTDFILETFLSINDAMWLIHYTFPSTWTRFTKRFSSSSSYYRSPLESKEGRVECKSFLMIDDQCEDKMPKILNLIGRLTKDFPEKYQIYAESVRGSLEKVKLANNLPLCNRLKLMGKCIDQFCEQRHIVDEFIDVSEDLPKNGKVIFKILNFRDVTHYTVQLIEHIDMNGISREINKDDLKKPLTFDSTATKKKAECIEVGKSYIHCDHTPEGELFMLCHAISLPEKFVLEVRLIGGQILQTRQSNLYEIPANSGIVEVYVCSLIPPQFDDRFSGRSHLVTKNSLEGMNYKNMVFTADVYLQLNEALWLNNVVEMAKVENADVIKFDLKKHLLKLKVAQVGETQITALRKLCARCNIPLPAYEKLKVIKTVKVKEIEPQRAFLDENISEVILSSAINPEEFYVRLAKFQSSLEDLEKDMTKAVKTEILDKDVNVTTGKYYLAPDAKGNVYSRVLILNMEDDKALCYYVDYGDEAVIENTQIKKLPTKFLKKLPFQAIQCRLYGISPAFDEWEDECTDVLYNYMFEPSSDIFRRLYVKVCNTEKINSSRAKTQYSVLFKDGFSDKNTLINQILIDCGFATSVFDKIDDFELPTFDKNRDSQDSDVDEVENDIFAEQTNIEVSNFDLEVHDMVNFLETIGLGRLAKSSNPELTYNQPEGVDANSSTVPQLEQSNKESYPKSNYLTPEVHWSQDEKNIRLKICLIDVAKYTTNVFKKRIFTFQTLLGDKNYELKFTLHKPVIMGKHKAFGQEVRVILNKVESLEWVQLTATNKRMRNIHYEITKEVEKPKRRFLQLDMTDDESDGNDKTMYHNISDLDSELDEEISESSD